MKRQVVLKNSETGEVYRRAYLGADDTLYAALERSQIPIQTTCRGSTICGMCRVTVETGAERLEPAKPDERALLDRFAPENPRARLACRLKLPEGVEEIEVSTPYWRSEQG